MRSTTSCWGRLGQCWAAACPGVAHRRLDAARILVRPDRTPAFGDFGGAVVAAAEDDLAADRAQVLPCCSRQRSNARPVTPSPPRTGTWTTSGRPAPMPPGLRFQARPAPPGVAPVDRPGGPGRVGRLRDHLGVGRCRAGQPDRRVQGGGPGVAGRGVGAVAGDPDGQGRRHPGASFRPLRFGPVLMLDHAIQFIALAVPSSAARLALDIRFFGGNGIDAGGAVSISAITSIGGFLIQVLLIVMISLSGLASLELGGTDATTGSSTGHPSSSGGYPLLVLTTVLVLTGVLVTVAVPKYRRAVTVPSRDTAPCSTPRPPRPPRPCGSCARPKVTMVLAGKLGAQLLQAIILGLVCGVRIPGHHGRTDPGEQHRRPVGRVHARARGMGSPKPPTPPDSSPWASPTPPRCPPRSPSGWPPPTSHRSGAPSPYAGYDSTRICERRRRSGPARVFAAPFIRTGGCGHRGVAVGCGSPATRRIA